MKLKRVAILVAVLFSLLYVQSLQVEALALPKVSYETHVQKNGWMPVVSDGELSGTTGLSYRMEALKIKVEGVPDLGIRYSAHVQGIGWQPYVADNAVSGTEGQARRLEALKVELTGENAKYYDVYYRVHVQKFGWLDWAKNGHAAGSAGYGYRVEALEVKVQFKGDAFEGSMDTSFNEKSYMGDITYRTHVESFGWLPTVSDGDLSGTTGKAKRMESLEISLSDRLPSGSVVYSTHVQSIGWMDPVKDGALSGTTGLAKRLEGVKIHLEGEISKMYGVTYRTHVQGYGWTSWVKDGEISGTTGEAKRLEAIEIKLYKKVELIPERPKPEEPFAYSIYRVTAKPTLNFRSSPSTSSSSNIIGKINYNEEVIVFEIDKNNWAKIEYDGKAGYVSGLYLTKVRDVPVDLLPLVLEVDPHKSEYDNEDVTISGIALSYSGLQSLTATLDGSPVSITRNDRPELESSYKSYPVKAGMGFTIQLAKSSISSGTHQLVIKARSNDYSMLSKTVSFTMAKSQTYVTIDSPANGVDQPAADLLVKGVALSAEGVKNVSYSVNGVKKGEAKYGLASPGHGFPEYEEITNAGYEFTLLKEELTKPVNSVRVDVTGHDGSTQYHSILIKGAANAAYSFEQYSNSLKYYVDLEYKNAVKYNTPGTALWNTLRTQMDPASYVHDDTYKYMFMDLSYAPTQYSVTEETLNKILSGMGILENTGHIFLAAAIEYKVNPYYLVVHAILETGRGTSVLANGQEVTFLHEKFGDASSPKKDVEPKMVYNMFGIGAWDVNPNLWGAQRAYERGWFSPEEAIAGGIKFIADDYVVARNQNTLFKMRYNLKGNMTHQYATDPLWAYKQAGILKREFDKYGIKENFSYIVPVYMK